jgi:hypothetical protein
MPNAPLRIEPPEPHFRVTFTNFLPPYDNLADKVS